MPEGLNIEMNCPVCGEPITHSNELGMFCDKECELEEAKAAEAVLMPWIQATGELMEQEQKKPEDKRIPPAEFMRRIMAMPEGKAVEEYAKKHDK
jgi:endogenous inhibitor of DNA gyrase (YacG/DUF329 family)